jgi:hypothetical protein
LPKKKKKQGGKSPVSGGTGTPGFPLSIKVTQNEEVAFLAKEQRLIFGSTKLLKKGNFDSF